MKKVAAETAHEGGPLALSTKFLVEEVAPLAADIKGFNSLDCAVKCPRRAEAVRLGAPDRIWGSKMLPISSLISVQYIRLTAG